MRQRKAKVRVATQDNSALLVWSATAMVVLVLISALVSGRASSPSTKALGGAGRASHHGAPHTDGLSSRHEKRHQDSPRRPPPPMPPRRSPPPLPMQAWPRPQAT